MITNEKAVRPNQVHVQMAELQSELEIALKIQDELTMRLQPALRSEPGEPNAKGAAPEEALVPLADNIRTARRQVHTLNENNRRLITLLEI